GVPRLSSVRRRAPVLRQPRRHFEAVDVRQLDVEQYDVRVQARDRLESALAVLGFADDLVALPFELTPGARPEARVVVDYQYRGVHAGVILAISESSANTATHTSPNV